MGRWLRRKCQCRATGALAGLRLSYQSVAFSAVIEADLVGGPVMSLSRRHLLQTASAMGALGLIGCRESGMTSTAPNRASDANAAAQSVLDSAKDFMLNAYPETASSMGIDKVEYAGLRAKLSDRSPDGQAAIAKQARAIFGKLDAMNTDDISPELALDVEVVASTFKRSADGFEFPYGDMALLNSNLSYRNSPYVVAQNTGAFIEIPSFLDSSHSIDSAGAAEDYLSRMSAYAGQLDGETDRIRRDGEQGMILPDFLMAKTLGQLKTARAQAPKDWSIVKSLTSRAAKYGAFDADAILIATDEIGPAMDRQIAALEALAPKAKPQAGVWAKPDGLDYYEWALGAGTTTNMSADEVHQMGLDQLAKLHAEMDPILRDLGYTDGGVGQRMTKLAEDSRYQFSPGDKGRAEIMRFIEEVVADIRGRMPDAFETLVPGFLEVTRIDPSVEAGAPGAYGGAGSVDGTKPGHFWINLRSTDLHTKFDLADLTYHEAIPGHVWQGEYTFKQSLIRSMLAFNAYSEGWALYAQQIAAELGVYENDAAGRLGYLQSLGFRACRLVVDTGLHAKQWTRRQANEWFVENNGSNPDAVRGEIDRYCAWPGQACGYMVGLTEINRLRNKAQAELGEKYDFRRFNDAVVLGGAVPMTVLGRIVDDYIARDA